MKPSLVFSCIFLTASGSSFGAVDIAEILIYNQALSDADRQAVEAYLNAKYGLY